jgi:hypothetical protein
MHPHVGLFRSACASICLAELMQDVNALRFGESHPLVVFLDNQNRFIVSPEFDIMFNRVV